MVDLIRWSEIKNFLKPSYLKLMIFFIFVTVYITIVFYQTFLLYSTASAIGSLQLSEIKSLVKDCPSNTECITSSQIKEIKFQSLNLLEPQLSQLINNYNKLELLRNILYPLSSELGYDSSLTAVYWLDRDTDPLVDQQFPTGFLEKKPIVSDNMISFDFNPYFGPQFFEGLLLFILYVYIIASLIDYFKRRVLQRIQDRFNIINY